MKNKPLIAYGNQEDRDKVAALAAHQGISVSAWILKAVREAYARRFGDAPAGTLHGKPSHAGR
jgi:hypothetical protein